MVSATTRQQPLNAQQLEQYQRDGYLIVPGMFSPDQVRTIREHFSAMYSEGFANRLWRPRRDSSDPLERFPRAMHPHRWDGGLSRRMMLDPAVGAALSQLLGEQPVACQSMYYFKPPGARGQALHQDNLYLKVAPATCIAAWTAIDPSLPENGGMYVVPGTHKLDVLCPETADDGESFTTHLVNAPKGMKAIPAAMQPGDTLFFNGSVIHGSGPNRSASHWRRSFICHYMPRSSSHVSDGYFPILDFAGNEISYQAATGGGPCGETWTPSSYGENAKLV